MLESRVARGLMLLGVSVGVLSVAVAALDMQVNLPDWMVRVAMIKLAFVASAGLLAAGALVGRHAKSRSLPASAPNLLPLERAEAFGQRTETRAPDEVEGAVVRGREPGERRSTDEREH
jgi:hypothetical protein